MDELLSCPTCHITVRETDYFCFNCGKNLKPKPPSLAVFRVCMLIIGSILLPPFGIVWSLPYIKFSNTAHRIIGLLLIVLSLISFIGSIYIAVDYANKINMQVNEEIMRLQRF